jgi:transposase
VILLAGSRRIIDMQIRSVGIDLGKTTFHLVALSAAGKVLLRKKFTQKQLITFTANMQTCLIGMEACSGAHFLGRVLREQGHNVKLIPAQFVKPFVKSNKNDFLDAEAIAEAVDRQNMRFVPIKTDDQLDIQAMHRVRDRLVARRTSVINQLRAFLLERGMVFAKTPFKLKQAMPEILENADANLTPRMRNLVSLLWSEWKDLEQQIVAMNEEVEQIASSDPACQRLRRITGSRGKGIQPRTLEIFDDLGIIEPILLAGGPYPRFRIHLGRLSIRAGSLGSSKPPTVITPYPNLWMVPQSRTEAILRERLDALGGRVDTYFSIALHDPAFISSRSMRE